MQLVFYYYTTSHVTAKLHNAHFCLKVSIPTTHNNQDFSKVIITYWK